MFKALKYLHIIALCVFIGSIPSHIVIGALAEAASDLQTFAAHHHAKQVLTANLTLFALAATILSGLLLGITRRSLFKCRWLQLKLAFIVLIALNGVFFLTPIATEMAALANAAVASGVLDEKFADLRSRESVGGVVNLLSIFIVVALAVVKPRFGQAASQGEVVGRQHG